MTVSVNFTNVKNMDSLLELSDGSFGTTLYDENDAECYLEMDRDTAMSLWNRLDVIFTAEITQKEEQADIDRIFKE